MMKKFLAEDKAALKNFLANKAYAFEGDNVLEKFVVQEIDRQQKLTSQNIGMQNDAEYFGWFPQEYILDFPYKASMTYPFISIGPNLQTSLSRTTQGDILLPSNEAAAVSFVQNISNAAADFKHLKARYPSNDKVFTKFALTRNTLLDCMNGVMEHSRDCLVLQDMDALLADTQGRRDFTNAVKAIVNEGGRVKTEMLNVATQTLQSRGLEIKA